MSRLQIPLRYRALATTGDIGLRADLKLMVKTRQGIWQRATFRVDSGTEMTTMPSARAKALDLPFPTQAVPGLVLGAQEVCAGYLRAQVVGMAGTEYVFPCYFLGDPNAPVHPSPGAPLPRYLLGLSGVINQLRISFDGDPGPWAKYGYLIVEKK